jgi:hypothetical protein
MGAMLKRTADGFPDSGQVGVLGARIPLPELDASRIPARDSGRIGATRVQELMSIKAMPASSGKIMPRHRIGRSP